jgi:membrane protein DedA with SNARE-associated domain
MTPAPAVRAGSIKSAMGNNMPDRMKKVLALLSMPLILLFSYFALAIVWKVFDWPTQEHMIEIVRSFFDRYGLLVVFVGAFIEGVLLLGQYFPGGFIIFLGVISAGDDVVRAVTVILVVSVAFSISYLLSYFMGRYGWHRLLMRFGLGDALETAQERVRGKGMHAIVFGYWEPNLASITATAAGTLLVPIRTFLMYSTIGILFWNTFWGALVFILGDAALKVMGPKYVLTIFAIWAGVILARYWFKQRQLNK